MSPSYPKKLHTSNTSAQKMDYQSQQLCFYDVQAMFNHATTTSLLRPLCSRVDDEPLLTLTLINSVSSKVSNQMEGE